MSRGNGELEKRGKREVGKRRIVAAGNMGKATDSALRSCADSPIHRLTDSDFGSALKYALKILGYRDRSMSEMRQKLTGKGFSKNIVDGTLAYLEEKAFIDDRRLAELLKRDAVERRHLGAQGVRSYLIRRGIAKDIADAMAEEDNDYLGAAMQLAEKKMRSIGHLDSVTIKRRLWGLLARRGFTSDEMRQVLKMLDVEF